jgi:hypothetical protein
MIKQRSVQPFSVDVSPDRLGQRAGKSPTTYYQLQREAEELEAGGAYLVGSEPGLSGPFPASPIDWAAAGVEPPLGECVNAFEPCGTPAEIEASIASLPAEEEPSQ